MRGSILIIASLTFVLEFPSLSLVPTSAKAELDRADPLDFSPPWNLASHDYIDAYDLPVDTNQYSWGSYAKKRNGGTRIRKPGVLHHARGNHRQLLSRQQCTAFENACLQGDGCCPQPTFCCLGVIAQGNCCNPGQICIGARTCCDQDQIGCGEACCEKTQECCGRKCCNTSGGFQCTTDNECVAASSNTIAQLLTTGSSTSTKSGKTTQTLKPTSTTQTPTSKADRTQDSKPGLSRIISIGSAIAGIVIALIVVIYLTLRRRQRLQMSLNHQTPMQNFVLPQGAQNNVEPKYETGGTLWVPPPAPTVYYTEDNGSSAHILSSQNQGHGYRNDISRPTTTAPSDYNSTYVSSNDYHSSQPWTSPPSLSHHQQPYAPANPPWAEGALTAPENSASRLERQNTKARYISAAQREEEAWETKRREAQASAGPSGSGSGSGSASSSNPVNLVNGSERRAEEIASVGANTGPVPELAPPAYSEYQPDSGPLGRT